MALLRKETVLLARRIMVPLLAYGAGVTVSALLTIAGFAIVFGTASWEFASFATVGIFVLSLPLTLLVVASRGTAASPPLGAVLIGCTNGLVSSALFVMAAGPLACAIMLPAGGIGGAAFWSVCHRMGRREPGRIVP